MSRSDTSSRRRSSAFLSDAARAATNANSRASSLAATSLLSVATVCDPYPNEDNHSTCGTRNAWGAKPARADLPKGFGLHGLRHYFATLLIRAGASVKSVQLALGHSSPTITLNTYTHEWPEALERTRSLIDSALGSSPDDGTTG
ncbi:tyrosine-type recombinase/integrase [Actinopolyspora saharensis]|uniref:tyrosine-type recombinase/integrase n=1 Tax=Actinopolyspora saharensis TaxID=995062 RepID=UPI003183CDE8